MSLNTGQRAAIREVANDLIDEAPTIGYPKPGEVIRPHIYRSLGWLRAYWAKGHESIWDCSIAAQQVFYCAGQASEPIKDPSGFSYEGFGNTESWLDRLRRYTNPVDAHLGALVVFGSDQPAQNQHGCIVIERGKDPILFSHGSEAGPIRISLSQELKAHPTAPPVFLDVSQL